MIITKTTGSGLKCLQDVKFQQNSSKTLRWNPQNKKLVWGQNSGEEIAYMHDFMCQTLCIYLELHVRTAGIPTPTHMGLTPQWPHRFELLWHVNPTCPHMENGRDNVEISPGIYLGHRAWCSIRSPQHMTRGAPLDSHVTVTAHAWHYHQAQNSGNKCLGITQALRSHDHKTYINRHQIKMRISWAHKEQKNQEK